ncbi:MAG TPA: hypothetical protein VHY31_05520 [Streptosporangiaceae bacterium]|jgi:hypothetical protein|nr:hypothetical protein [Streptosporangiaceae bacterium]
MINDAVARRAAAGQAGDPGQPGQPGSEPDRPPLTADEALVTELAAASASQFANGQQRVLISNLPPSG